MEDQEIKIASQKKALAKRSFQRQEKTREKRMKEVNSLKLNQNISDLRPA